MGIMFSTRKLIMTSLDWTRPKDPPMSLGQASICANLLQYKVPVISRSWAFNHASFNYQDVHRFIMDHADHQTDFALGAYVWHEPATQALLTALKRDKFPGRIILGGPQISYTKDNIERFYPQADIFIRGYGEKPLARLLTSPQEKPIIAGVHYAGEPDLGLSANVDLESLPSPFLTGLIPPQPFIRWETQRGCPFRCSFCQHRESGSESMERRQFAHSRIMDEIRWITEHPIIQDVAVLDPTFNSGPYYLQIMEALIARKYRGKLALQCRAEMIQEEFLDLIEELNKTAHVVLELGLQTIHKEEQRLIQRPNNMTKISHVLSETKKRNISTEISLIFGLPKQTVQSFHDSIQYCKEMGVPTIYAYPLMLLRGTPLYDNKEKLGLVESSEVSLPSIERVQQNIPHVIASPSFTTDDWYTMANMAEALDTYNSKNAQASAKMLKTLQHTFWASKQAIKSNHTETVEKSTTPGLSMGGDSS